MTHFKVNLLVGWCVLVLWPLHLLRLASERKKMNEFPREQSDRVPPRWVAKGNEVWDTAWSNPFTNEVTSGVDRNLVVTRYPSVTAAYEAATSLNEYRATTVDEVEARFRADAKACIAEFNHEQEVRASLLPAWVEGIDGLDTL